MMAVPIALSDTDQTMWTVAVGAGFVVVLVVAALMLLLVGFVKAIEERVVALLELAALVAANTEHIPQLEATPPVLRQIVDEAVVQDAYMNALTQGYSKEPG